MKKWAAMVLSLALAYMWLPATGLAAGVVATVDNDEYTSVQQAIDNANGKTVVLVDDVTESITIPKSHSVTLDLGGFTLTNQTGQHTITNNGTLTIQGSGTVDNISHAKGALVNNAGASVEIKGGTLTRSQEKGNAPNNSGGNSWYVVDNHGVMTVNGGTIINTSGFSSLIRNLGGTFNMVSGTLENTFIALKNDDEGVVNMTGGNVITKDGSALQNWGTADISGGVLSVTGSGVAIQALEWDVRYQSVTNVKAGAVVKGDILVRQDPDYAVGQIEFNVTGGSIQGSVTAGAGAEVALKGGSFEGALSVADQSGMLEVTGGVYRQTPVKYLAEGIAAAGISEQGAAANFFVGTQQEIEEKISQTTKGDQIEVLSGSFDVKLPDGVTIVNSGSGEVIVNGEEVTSSGLITHIHQAVKVEAKEATATEAGNIAYWYCEGCGKYFSDEALTKELTKEQIVIPAKGETQDAQSVSPETSDNGTMALWAVLFSVAAVGITAMACMMIQRKKVQ